MPVQRHFAELAASGASGRVFVRRASAEQRAAVANSRLVWLEQPAKIGDALARARLIVHHGSMLMAEELLIAGRPQALVPLYLEHLLTARALLPLGVAMVLPATRSVDEMAAAVRSALANDAAFRSARSWALQRASEVQLDPRRAHILVCALITARNCRGSGHVPSFWPNEGKLSPASGVERRLVVRAHRRGVRW